MPWSERAEVPVVQGRQLGLVHTLDDGQDPRIDESNVGVVIAVAEGSDAGVVNGLKVLDAVRARLDIVEEGHENAGMQAGVNPVVHLHEHRRRDDQRLLGFFDEPPGGNVISVASVERSV